MYKNKALSLIKIVKCLEEAEEGWLWLREIGRRCELSHTTVSRLVDNELSMFVDVQVMEQFNTKMVKLRPGVTVDSVARYLAVKEKIKKQPITRVLEGKE